MPKEKLMLGMILFAMILSLVGISYALYTYRIEKEQVFTIIAGDLAYTLTCNRLDEERKITLSPGQVEVLEIKVGSLNEFETAYKVYYTGGNDGVKVSYYQNEVYQGEGTLNKEEQDVIQVILENNSQEEVRLQFGIEGGFVGKDLVLGEGKELVQFQGDIVLAYRYEGGGTPPSSFPKKEDGYQVKEVECKNATGVWDSDNWEAKISLITGSGAICTVVFTKEYRDASGANPPKLVDGMIPVTYNGTSWVKADIYGEWYNYEKQMWANAVTVVENGTNTREYYQSAPAETVIPMEDINTMWVWVPRYEYQYTNLGTQYAGGTKAQPGEIQINFISKETTSPSSSEYKVHPAFTFGGTELSGIWVGKFETTGTLPSQNYCRDESCNVSTVTIKPGVTSLRNQQVASLFYMTRSMQTNNASTYGFASDNSYNIHMAKNSEWGAVAYLSQSRYGKYGNPDYEGVNKEIYQNKSSSSITGSSNGTPSTESTNPQVSYDTPYSGYGASTTGTIYGIYDMSGGSSEYVMGNYNNIIGSSGFSSMPDSKYYDLYTTTDSTTACGGDICYGHALTETAGWYNDSAGFVTASIPWFSRGGRWSNTTNAGVFYSNYTFGGASGSYASRAVLAQGA